LPCPWIVSYDDVENVYTLYNKIPYLRYQLHYSAQIKRRSGEVMFFQGLEIPPIVDTKLWYPMYVLKSSVHKKTTSACTDKSQVSR
ncbi:MAG: hypothetical protein L3J76_02565, partial [Candidatus Hydrothermae bacterium]|nr:hypothetical protein [Candidatus Hydrothermae bacterium]